MSIKIGIIGTGRIAEKHIAALQKLPDAKIVAITGRNISRLEVFAKQTDAKAYENYWDMLSKENLDAVFILLPPYAHGEVEKACAAHVRAVFIEKPVCNSLEQAGEIGRVFRDSGTIVSVGYKMRYQDSIERARAVFKNNRPILVSGHWVTPPPRTEWLKNKSLSGGQFVEQSTHILDAARYIAGEIMTVSAFGATGFVNDVPGYDVYDAMTVNVLFESGAIGNFSMGCFLREDIGSDGIGLYIASRDTRCKFYGKGMGMDIENSDGSCEHFDERNNSIIEAEDAAFIEAVIKRDTSLIRSTYDDAVRTLGVTLAANESRINHCTVTI